MVIGITGIIGTQKKEFMKLFKEKYPKYWGHLTLYIDGDEKLGGLLHIDTPSFNSVKENLGDEWEKYQDKGICHYYNTDKLMRNPDDYKIFMDTMRPYMTCKLSKICGRFYKEKIIVIFMNHLLDYEWSEFCDKIIVIQNSEERRNRRYKKKGIKPDKVPELLSKFLSEEECIEKADWVINFSEENEVVRNRAMKTMMKGLSAYRKALESGEEIPKSDEIIERNQKILDDCYEKYAPRLAAAQTAKEIANLYGYDIDIKFTGELENHRDVVGGPLEEGETTELSKQAQERKEKYKEIMADLREKGLPTNKQIKAKERAEKEARRRKAQKIREAKEAKKRAEAKKEKERERQKKRKQAKIQREIEAGTFQPKRHQPKDTGIASSRVSTSTGQRHNCNVVMSTNTPRTPQRDSGARTPQRSGDAGRTPQRTPQRPGASAGPSRTPQRANTIKLTI